MNWFQHFKITHYLYTILFMMILSFIIIGLTYNSILDYEHESSMRVAEVEKIQILTEQTHIAYLKSRIVEQEFFFTHNENKINEFKKILAQIYNNIAILTKNSQSEQKTLDLKTLTLDLKEYQTSFYNASNLAIKIGLSNENTGDIGMFRGNAHKLEKLIRRAKKSNLLVSLLQQRRHEKDFLARNNNKYLKKMDLEFKNFKSQLAKLKLTPALAENISRHIDAYNTDFNNATLNILKLNQLIQIVTDKTTVIEPEFNQVLLETDKTNHAILSDEKIVSQQISLFFIAVTVCAALLLGLMLFMLSRKLITTLNTINYTIVEYSKGDNNIRNNISANDELGVVAQALDTMMDERVATQLKLETENEVLNDSIIELLESASKVSDKDLTVKMRVAENITGPLSDALNQVIEETANVLSNIQSVANKVQLTSETVNTQGQKVSDLAELERKIIDDAVLNLDQTSLTMKQMSELAQKCNQIANSTSTITNNALNTVNETADGMNDIRETISETEKRIKRLGERSQEITGVVDIINTIAERTHVLALNASMHAAAAGEAGRSFAVVADEVQRLAESSRDSTSRIASLVKNIQTETAETMSVMNKTIDKVVVGSKLAEKAGKEMIETQKNTSELTRSIKIIADQSEQQMHASDDIKNKVYSIKQSTLTTNTELQEQARNTQDLTDFSDELIKSVAIFKLPAA